MGQYYDAVLSPDFYSYTVYVPEARKLTEHSFVGDAPEYLCSILHEGAQRVLWVGDYAEPEDIAGENAPFENRTLAKEICEAVKENSGEPMTDTQFDTRSRFLVNLSKREYVDMAAYIHRASVRHWSADSEEEMCIHPLPILTAVGNGRGGGDYWGTDEDLAGAWAFDWIAVTDDPPAPDMRFNEIFPTFIECSNIPNTRIA